jgi:hypothetical protein
MFCANAAWTVIAALAYNLLRWTGVLGLPAQTIGAARTLSRRGYPNARVTAAPRAATQAQRDRDRRANTLNTLNALTSPNITNIQTANTPATNPTVDPG